MKKIVFDIETSNTFSDVGSSNPADLDMAVVAIHDSETGDFSTYEISELQTLWPIIEKADMLIGFNSDHFDIPLLNKYYSGDLSKIRSLDILSEVKKSIGRRIKLDNIAKATLGRGKIGDGLEAIVWWRNGEKDKVKEYCIDDVRLTKEIYDYALRNNMLKYNDGNDIVDIKLDTSTWEKKDDSTMTHTLPLKRKEIQNPP